MSSDKPGRRLRRLVDASGPEALIRHDPDFAVEHDLTDKGLVDLRICTGLSYSLQDSADLGVDDRHELLLQLECTLYV